MCLLQIGYICKRRKNFTSALQMAQLSFGEVFIFLTPSIFEQSTYLSPVQAAVRLQTKAHGALLWVFIRVLTSSQSSFLSFFFKGRGTCKICRSNIRTVAWNQLHCLFKYSDWCPHLCVKSGVGAEEHHFWEFACGMKWWEVSVWTTWGRAAESVARGIHWCPIYY